MRHLIDDIDFIDFIVSHYEKYPEKEYRPHRGGLKEAFDQLTRDGIMEKFTIDDGTYYRLTSD